MDVPTHIVRKATSLKIRELPADVLVLIFLLLDGQDIARCITVCHAFADLIHADLSLRYRIELAQNGMVDGECSTLPVAEKLQRLRQYSSDLERGAFMHEDLTAHPNYLLQDRELGWPRAVLSAERPSGGLYKKCYQDDSPLYLSLFVPGSAQGGIPSSRSLITIREMEKPDLATVADWAMDETQDLFVVADMTRLSFEEEMNGKVPELYIRFYSLSGLKMGRVTPHPAATLPFVRLHTVDSGKPRGVFKLQIIGDYLVFELWVEIGADRTSFFVDVYNWKTGRMMSTINVGPVMVSIIPLDEPYLLLFPSFSPGPTRMPERHPNLSVYSFFPPASSWSESAPMAGRHVCTLELPTPRPGEHVTWSRAHTGDQRAEETMGHFRTDPTRSIVVLYINIQPIEGRDDNDRDEYATYLLIPRATLSAQIRAAESTWDHLYGKLGDTANPPMLSVPWADWGPRGCLRLRPRNPLFYDDVELTAFGSRMPVVMFDGPEKKSASVYVFDVNPLVARSVLAARSTTGEEKKDEEEVPDLRLVGDTLSRAVTVIAVDGDREDIEKVLPGIVDPDCAAIPYAVYRFPLPYSEGRESQILPEIREVTMNMAGFTVEFDGSVDYEKRFQTWTV